MSNSVYAPTISANIKKFSMPVGLFMISDMNYTM